MFKTISSSRPIITLSIDLRTILLLTFSFILFALFIIPYPAPQLLTPAPPLFEDASTRLGQKHSLVHEKLLSDMPACATGWAPTFLMVFMGHSGTTAIMTSLQQHSQTHIPTFEPVDHGVYRSGKSSDHSLLALNYTDYFFRNATKLNLTAGFKIRPPNIMARPAEFARLVNTYGTRIIWSYRTNVFKQAISDYNIHYYGDTAGHEGVKIKDPSVETHTTRNSTIRITSMTNLHKLLKSRIHGEKQVQDALRAIRPDGCVLPVSYESYLAHPDVTLKRVQQFLGLDTQEIHASLRGKANSDTICELVENWQEVCAAFFGCVQWRWMLDDFQNGCSCTSLNPSEFSDSKKFCSLA